MRIAALACKMGTGQSRDNVGAVKEEVEGVLESSHRRGLNRKQLLSPPPPTCLHPFPNISRPVQTHLPLLPRPTYPRVLLPSLSSLLPSQRPLLPHFPLRQVL